MIFLRWHILAGVDFGLRRDAETVLDRKFPESLVGDASDCGGGTELTVMIPEATYHSIQLPSGINWT
jgi:hypothetical protein